MALLVNLYLDSGVTIEDTYCKILSIGGNKENAVIEIAFYKNIEALNQSKPEITRKYFSFIPSVDINSKNWYTQAYYHLKCLDEFSEAVDIL